MKKLLAMLLAPVIGFALASTAWANDPQPDAVQLWEGGPPPVPYVVPVYVDGDVTAGIDHWETNSVVLGDCTVVTSSSSRVLNEETKKKNNLLRDQEGVIATRSCRPFTMTKGNRGPWRGKV